MVNMGDFTVYSAAHLAAEQTHKNLMKELPSLLSCISKSHFVALDFEYSGIERGIEDRKESRTKPDIAEYYRRVSEAARLYSVLQVGITCVFEDGEKGRSFSRCEDGWLSVY